MLRIDQLPHTAFLICKSSHRPEIRRKLCFNGIGQTLFVCIRRQIDSSTIMKDFSRLHIKGSGLIYIFRAYRSGLSIHPYRISTDTVTDAHLKRECGILLHKVERNIQTSYLCITSRAADCYLCIFSGCDNCIFAFYLRRLTVSILRHTLFSRKGPAKYSFDISLAEIRCFHFCDQPFSCLIGIMWQFYQNPTLLKKFPEPFRSGKIIGLRF